VRPKGDAAVDLSWILLVLVLVAATLGLIALCDRKSDAP
jgi:hypothetical protein